MNVTRFFMTIAEPVTLLTDYTLALVSGWLGWKLCACPERQLSRRCWAAGFIALALAAFLGGTYHGFAQQFHPFLHDMASRWVLFALALSALAAGVQYGRWALHAHFNHNDLYHVIQIGAMVLFYKAGKLLRDARQMP